MNGIDEGVINCEVYEDGKRFLGIARVTLPSLESKKFTMSGLGISGDIDIPVLATRNAMHMSIVFRNDNEGTDTLAEERVHLLDLRVIHQNLDYSEGEIGTTNRKYVVKVFPVSSSGGDIQSASAQEVTNEFSVFSLKKYINGKLARHIDPINFIDRDHTGKDRAEAIRKGLGR